MGKLAELLENVGTREVTFTQDKQVDDLDGRARTAVVEGAHDAADYGDILTTCGHDPSQVTFAAPPSIYTRWKNDGEQVTTYRYKLKPVERSTLDDLLDQIKARPLHKPAGLVGGVFNFQASDLQIGKSDNGGTTDIVDGYLRSVSRAADQLKQAKLRQSVEGIHLIFAGDCIEGNQSQSGRNMWRTDMTVTEQTRVFRHLLYQTIEAFRDEADYVKVDVVNGNHDEVQRFQTTRPDDGHATEAAIAVREGLAYNPGAYGHVEVRVPPVDQGYMTVGAGDTVFTVAHGHQWKRGQAEAWWKGQTFYSHAAGAADILAHGHFHEFAIERTGSRMRICSPTFDMGSNYYREMTGAFSPPGGVAYMTREGRFSDLSIV
jgi:predicted phosphodiesterase